MRRNTPGGFSAVTSVIIISTVLITMGILLNARLRSSFDTENTGLASTKALSAAESCVQEGFLQLRINRGFSGGNLNLGMASCTMTITQAGSNYTINSVGTLQGSNARITLELEDQASLLVPLRKQITP